MNADQSNHRFPQESIPRPEWIDGTRWFWGFLAVTTLWKVFAGRNLGLVFDECYYWEWALHPGLCYLDHPPMTAWMIALGRALLGHTSLAIRVWSILAGVLLALFGRALARTMFGESAGNRAGIFLMLAPIFFGNSFLMTPDSWLVTAWMASTFFAWKAIRTDGATAWWLLTGASAGIGMLCKYTMVLFYAALSLFCLTEYGRRWKLLSGLFLASVTSLLLFLPALVWNSSHGWVSFQHQFHHGFGNEHPDVWIHAGNLLDYILFLILLVSPVLAILCFRSASYGNLREERFRYLGTFFWTVVLFFGFAAAKAHVEANWPMTAFVTGLVLVAGDWKSFGKTWRRTALILLLLTDFGAVAAISYLCLPEDSMMRLQGFRSDTSWSNGSKGIPGTATVATAIAQNLSDLQLRLEEFKGPAKVADAIRKEFRSSGADFLCPTSYQLFGILSYYAPDLEPLLWLPYQGRLRFPWIKYRDWDGKSALIVSWPRHYTDYHWLFAEQAPAVPIPVEGIGTPVSASFGRRFRADRTTDR